jgi:flagellar biosynthetic protein FliR
MLISIAQTQVFFLVLTRVLAVIIHIPNLGGQTIPTQIRIGLGLILAAILVPWTTLLSAEVESMALLTFAAAILKEIIIGTFIGYAAILTFAVISIAGETMGIGSGFGSDRIFNPAIEQSVTPIGQLFVVISMLYFMALNGHHISLVALQKSFSLLPVNSPLPVFSVETIIRSTAQLIAVGIQIAFPIFAALLLTDITLGLLSRVAPQVQVYFLGLPLKIGLSLFALGLSLSIFFPYLRDLFSNLGARMLSMGAF